MSKYLSWVLSVALIIGICIGHVWFVKVGLILLLIRAGLEDLIKRKGKIDV